MYSATHVWLVNKVILLHEHPSSVMHECMHTTKTLIHRRWNREGKDGGGGGMPPPLFSEKAVNIINTIHIYIRSYISHLSLNPIQAEGGYEP